MTHVPNPNLPIASAVNEALRPLTGPFGACTASISSAGGSLSGAFGSVIHLGLNDADTVPAPAVAAVLVCEETLTVESLRAAYQRIHEAKDASVIIQNARQTADPDALRGLSQDEITQSQELLVLGFHQMRRGFGGRLIMLDAHSVIDTDRGSYEIDVDVMRRLQSHVFVHVEDDVEAILLRRLNDSTRARPLAVPAPASDIPRAIP